MAVTVNMECINRVDASSLHGYCTPKRHSTRRAMPESIRAEALSYKRNVQLGTNTRVFMQNPTIVRPVGLRHETQQINFAE